MDQKFLNLQYTVRDHCHAVAVGKTCPPCEQLFALNYAGSLQEVSCEEFFKSIEKKNKICDNCLKKIDRFGEEETQ